MIRQTPASKCGRIAQIEQLEGRTLLSGTTLEPLTPTVESGTLAQSGSTETYDILMSKPGWLGASVFRVTNVGNAEVSLELTGEGKDLTGVSIGQITWQSEENRFPAGTYVLTVNRRDSGNETGTPTPVKYQMTIQTIYAGESTALAEQAGPLNRSVSFDGFAGILPGIGQDTDNYYELTAAAQTIVTAALGGSTGDAVAIGQTVNGIWTGSPLGMPNQSLVVQPGPFYVIVDSIRGPFQTYHLDVKATPLPAVSIDDPKVVPTAATDLHLKEVFGGEQVNIPLQLTGLAQSGKATVTIGISNSSDGSHWTPITPTQLTFGTTVVKSNSFNETGPWMTVTAQAMIPEYLPAGVGYHLVAQVTGPVSNEAIFATSAGVYENVGTPNYFYYGPLFNGALAKSVFNSGVPNSWDDYFSYIRNLLTANKAKRAINRAPNAAAASAATGGLNPANAESFIEAFEGLRTAPYIDGNQHPSIGIGINLDTFNSGTQFTSPTWLLLKKYLTQYNPANTAGKSDAQILGWLETLAGQAKPTQVIANAGGQAILDSTWSSYQTDATDYLGATWSKLDAYGQAAMTDMQFNGSLSKFNGVVASLSMTNGPDYLQAAFDLANSKSAYDPTNRGQNLRCEAEFQNLLWARANLIGSFVT